MAVATSPERTAAAVRTSYENLPRPQLVATMAGLLATLFLAALDQTIVGTAMPRIVAELHGFELYAWATTAYLLTSTAVVPIVGKLSDLYGRKPFLIGGAVSFVLASMLCGLAQDMIQLAAFRGLQGIGGGVLMSSVFTTASALFPPAQRARIQGIFSAVFGLSSIAGPLIGGYLTDQLSWRWVFYVNVPVGVVALSLLWLAFTDIRQPRAHRIDYPGALVLVAGTVALLLALTWGGHDYPWLSLQIGGLLAFTAAMMVVFVAIERSAPEPILPLSLFQNSIVTTATIAVALATVGMFGTVLFVPLFIQAVIGTSATTSGTVLMPMMLAMVASSIGVGQIVAHTGRYKLAALGGLTLSTIGLFLLTQMSTDTDFGTVIRNMTLLGLGMGAMMPCFNLAAQNAVSMSQLGVVTALTQFVRSIGGTFGTAFLGSMLVNAYTPTLQQALPSSVTGSVPPALLAQVSNPQSLLNPQAGELIRQSFAQLGPQGPQLAEAVLGAVRMALASSLHQVFFIGTVAMAMATVVTLFLKDLPLRRTFTDEPGNDRAQRA